MSELPGVGVDRQTLTQQREEAKAAAQLETRKRREAKDALRRTRDERRAVASARHLAEMRAINAWFQGEMDKLKPRKR